MTRKQKITVVILIIVAVIALMSTACSTSSNEEINVWIGGSIVGEDELEESQDTWIISQLLHEYEDTNNVKINLTYFEDEEAMVQLIANNGRTGNEVPDLACIYSSEIIRDMQDVIYPVTSFISNEEKENILFWETVTDDGNAISDSSIVLGYPIGGTEVTFMAYNKEIFQTIGIDVESNPPKTFEDFTKICEELLSSGITPIVASDGGWNELYLQLFAKKWVQFSGDANIIDIAKGTNSFASDSDLISSLELASDYYSKGYINCDYATNTDAPTLFANGKGAMFSCSNYDINLFKSVMGDNLGVFWVPDYEGNVVYSHLSFGGCNQCLSVFNESKHKEDAIKIIKWLSNKENNIRMVKRFGCFPNRSDVTLDEYDSNPSDITKKIFPLIQYAHSTPDYLMPMKVYSDFYRYSLAVMIGQMTINEFTMKMDALTNAQ